MSMINIISTATIVGSSAAGAIGGLALSNHMGWEGIPQIASVGVGAGAGCGVGFGLSMLEHNVACNLAIKKAAANINAAFNAADAAQ